MFKERNMFSVPLGINEHEKNDRGKSTEALKAELLEYQKRMEEIAAELARRENISTQEKTEEELLYAQVAELREALGYENEVRVEEFDNQRSEELEEKITGDDFRKRTLEYLENAGVVKYKAGQAYFDMDKFKSKEFYEQFKVTYLGMRDGFSRKGSKQEVYKMFEGTKVIGLSGGSDKENGPQELRDLNYSHSLEILKNRLINKLRANKIIEEKDGLTVFDIDKFKKFKFGISLGEINGKQISPSRNTIFRFLKDLKVVSNDDYFAADEDKSRLKEISLFNEPESVNEAYDAKIIKNKSYYLNFWDIKSGSDSSSVMQWGVHGDFRAKNNEKVDLKEFCLATTIFRDFNGVRENGVLMVDNPKTKIRQKINYDWILDNVGGMSTLKGGIHNFLRDNCPNLLKKGLLKNSDFEIQTNREAGQVARKEYYPKGKLFNVHTKGVNYYIGRQYFIEGDRRIPIKNIKVVLLDQKTLGIVSNIDGKEKLEYTIDMLNQEEIEEKKRLLQEKDGQKLSEKEMKGRISVKEEEREKIMNKFSLSSIIMRKAGESEEEYLNRASNVSEYNHVKDVSENLLNECKVSIHNLSWREQVWLSSAEYELRLQNRYDEFVDFVKNYGLTGLRVLLSCEQDISNAQEIMNFSKKEEPEMVEEIFSSYAKIQEIAKSLESVMHSREYVENENASSEVKMKLRNNLYDAFVSRATDILKTAFVLSEKGEAKATFYNGKEINISKVEEVHEALLVYQDFLEKMKGFFTEESQYQFSYTDMTDKEELKIYHFLVNDKYSEEQSHCSLSIRPEGNNEFLQDYEYDGEARINFLFSPEIISTNINDQSRREATTFRLDRECMTFDDEGKNVIGKDFTRKDGKVSLDFGSIYEDAGRENSVLGRVMSVGNYYNAQKKKSAPEFYHNKEAFYQELGDADAFKQITSLVEEYVKKRFIEKK